MTRSSAPWLLCALLWAGCSTVLDTNDPFFLAAGSGGAGTEGGATGAGGNLGSGAAGGAVLAGSGGARPDSGPGGSSGAGGHSVAAPDAGDAAPAAGSHCRAGHYTGAVDGTHVPGITVVGVPFRVKTGTVSFDLQGSGNVFTVHNGTLDAELGDLLGTEGGSLSAPSLTGTVDCSVLPATLTGELSADLVVVNLFRGKVLGTWVGVMDATGAFTGTWGEMEIDPASPGSGTAPTSCGSARQPALGTGCGTWEAR